MDFVVYVMDRMSFFNGGLYMIFFVCRVIFSLNRVMFEGSDLLKYFFNWRMFCFVVRMRVL